MRRRGPLLAVLLWSAAAGSAHAEPADPAASNAAPAVEKAVELGASFQALQRGSASERVEYGSSLAWEVHGNVLLTPWLGVRTAGGMEYLSARLRPGATGVAGDALNQPSLSGPRVTATLQPTYAINPCWQLFGRAGAAWQRLVSERVEVSDPTPLFISERSGVIVEFPLEVGARRLLFNDWLAVSLSGGLRLAGPQTGDLFNPEAGTSQSLRQDTGELVTVDALPHFGTAFFASLSLDLIL